MFKFQFSEYISFLDVCEKTYQAVDEHCHTCEGAMLRMQENGFAGLTATAADIKFLNWYNAATINTASLVLLHAFGEELLNSASQLKNTAESIPASIGASSRQMMPWTSSEVAVNGSASALSTKVQGICDVEISALESTLSKISSSIWMVRGAGAIQGAVSSMRGALDEEKAKLNSLKQATDTLVNGVSDFEANNAEVTLDDLLVRLSMGDVGLIQQVSTVALSSTVSTLLKDLADPLRAMLQSGYDIEIQKVLSAVGIDQAGTIRRTTDGYAILRGYRLSDGRRAPSRIRLSGSSSVVGSGALAADNLRIDGARATKALPGIIKVGGKAINVLSVGVGVYEGYNRSADATDGERVVHAATEGTIAAAGIGASIGTGALLGSAVCPGLGTVAGIVVGAIWGGVTWALGETKDENGVSYMEHIDNAAYDLVTSAGAHYTDGYSWQGYYGGVY